VSIPLDDRASGPAADAENGAAGPPTLRDQDWLILLKAIRRGKCTPFLGAGACQGYIPLGSDIARDWAQIHKYPLNDFTDLAKVSQFLATEYDAAFPKDEMIQRLEGVKTPDFAALDEPHAVLADLPLPVYITTNYDDFMMRALRSRNRDPEREMCRWNKFLQAEPSLFDNFEPTVARPVVFHLHGCSDVSESLVLTEDDYLDFLVKIWKEALIPPRIERALSGASLLFLGYRLADWDFRVLFHGLVTYIERSLQRGHVSVQLVPLDKGASIEQKARVQRYLDRYFDRLKISVYWGDCRLFVAELRRRWQTFQTEHA
jgi:SIR2-like domain